ncbi:MAG: ATP-dependent Clp protease ATP-binding subunit, partial [Flavobacteriales bacterium]|nr:ATP-dependent Clp protease ATP-binding subunit [Flavobacteriales bacterium]
KKAFAPEFLNRIDDVVIFNSLSREDIHKIIDIELERLYGRITKLGYKVKMSDAAKDIIAERGFDDKFGARPLKRAIQKYVEDPLAEEIINSNVGEGDTIQIGYKKDKDDVTIKIVKAKKSEEKKSDEE